MMWIVDMSCPDDGNVAKKEKEKRRNYQDLRFELRLQRPEWKTRVVPLAVGATGGMDHLEEEIQMCLQNETTARWCAREMKKVAVQGSQQMIHRVECGLI